MSKFLGTKGPTAENRMFDTKLLIVLGSSPSEEKQQGLSVAKDLLTQLFKYCLVNLARTELLVHLDQRVSQEWMEKMENRDQMTNKDQLAHRE